MSILIDHETRVCLQGITGPMGRFQAEEMRRYGTRLVAGVGPGRGGQTVDRVPVFDTVSRATAETGAELSLIFVAAQRAKDAILEAIDAGIRLVVCVAEFMPLQDVIVVLRRARETGTRLIGPNCSGLISPGKAKAGFYCDEVCMPGDVGVIAKSGTLSYAVLVEMKRHGLGASTVVGIGGDEMKGTTFRDSIELFEQDPDTRSILLIGEVGGRDEEQAAAYIAEKGSKPVVGFVAGRTIPPGRSIGHAGALVQGAKGTWNGKVRALESAGVRVATVIEDIPKLLSA
jgi:succinyl-CoA synthetase alpha subunit